MNRVHFTQHWLLIVCAALCIVGCVSLPSQATRPAGPAYEPAASDNELSRTFKSNIDHHQPASGFHVVSAGIDGLLLRLELIERAQSELDLQYYIFRSDDSGKRLQQALLRAADRGVHVRIISDDGETVPGDEKLLLLAAHPRIEVRMFNPFSYRGHNGFLRGMDFLFHKSRLDYRMHNKLMVVDDTVALTGGRNIGDQYFQVDPASQFGDDDVFAVGPAVSRLQAEFAEYWNSAIVVPANRLMVRKADETALTRYRTELGAPHPLLEKYATAFDARLRAGEPLNSILTDENAITWAQAQVLYDSPEKKKARKGERFGHLMYAPIASEIAATHSDLLVVTPYLVPTPEELKLLAQQTERQVQVRILTNSLMACPDVVAQAGYARYRQTLLQDGVRLYEIRANLGNTRGSGETRKIARFGTYALHAKLFVFDRDAVFIGSMNLDQRSVRLNTEMGLIISSGHLADTLTARFNALASPENAYQVMLDDPPHHSAPQLVWRTQEKGAMVEYRTEPARSGWQKFELKFFSLLPLDDEL
jgi:putative cardiolipin synthase